ncbi:polysaccharide export protein [Rhodobacteraceae bacterium RKSG542]|nr:polysaccharide export protein [Pseudovibrio flavus]
MLAGCSALPNDGPSAYAISSEQVNEDAYTANYALVELDDAALQTLRHYAPAGFAEQFGGVPQRGATQVLGVGDSLSISIWEAAQDGLFSTATSKKSRVETQVDENGFIFVPYAGRIRAKGLSVEGVRSVIQRQLTGKAIEPQVVVHLTGNRSNSVVVVGDVNKPGRYPISSQGSRLLEIVAEAGGASKTTYETVVTLKRQGRSGTARFEELIENPRNNIQVASGDNILLSYHPRSFSAFGAVAREQLVPFKTKSLSLAEAIALVGGLSDYRADPTGVFLFRYEDRSLVQRLQPQREIMQGGKVPVIYRLNVRQANGYLKARSFSMRDKDILYVSSHPTAEFGKFLQILAPLLSNVATVNNLELF